MTVSLNGTKFLLLTNFLNSFDKNVNWNVQLRAYYNLQN